MQDTEWAAAALQGDEEAFGRLVALHRRQLYGIAFSYLGNEPDTLEALQESICRAWIKCGKLKDPSLFLPWIIRIVINCCMDELKRRKRTSPLYATNLSDFPAPEMVNVQKLDLAQALARIKPKYRHALMLKYYQDMTVPQIAVVLGCPEGTVKTWLHQGLKQLRRHLSLGGERYDR